MNVKFWGVRGSTPSPGPDTVRYGGNTSCLSVELDEDNTLVLDAGTGIRMLGNAAKPGKHTFFLLLTHLHWDHIQGLPFFKPVMDPDKTLRILCGAEQGWGPDLINQIDGIHFPLSQNDLRAEIESCRKPYDEVLASFDIEIRSLQANHCGVCYGYRLDHDDRSLVYMTDNEIDSPNHLHSTREDLIAFASGATTFVHDAQYVDTNMPQKRGWGHSTVRNACDIAAQARVHELILFHHDPDRTDDEVDIMVEQANLLLKEQNSPVICTAACERMTRYI